MVACERAALEARYLAVQNRLREAAHKAGRKPESLCLIAVSKQQPASRLEMLAGLGHKVFGENYIQEACAKQEQLEALGLEWHFIGRLQSNKAKEAAGRFSLIHTVDSVRLATMLQKTLEKRQQSPEGSVCRQGVLLQVNIGAEPQKAGVDPKELVALAQAVCACPLLEIKGLMCLPPVFDAGEASRPFFAALRALRDRLEPELGMSLPYLSMGMSGDAEWAVLEGATHVRIGTDIFGSRVY